GRRSPRIPRPAPRTGHSGRSSCGTGCRTACASSPSRASRWVAHHSCTFVSGALAIGSRVCTSADAARSSAEGGSTCEGLDHHRRVLAAGRGVQLITQQPVAFIAFTVAAAATPGPSNMLLATTGAQRGLLRGLPALAAASAVGQSLELGITFAAMTVPCFLLWLVFGAVLQRLLQSERAARGFNIAMAALLATSVIFLIL